jgi:hypothetical protein
MPWALPLSSPASPAPTQAVRQGRKRRTPPGPPLLSFFLSASCRPAWSRQRRPTEPHRQDRTPLAREQGRHARCCHARRQDTLRRPLLDALALGLLAYKKTPPSPRMNAPHPQQAPGQPLFSPLALVRRSLQRRRATGRRQRRRIGPPLDKRTPGSGGGVLPESFPPLAVKPCFPYAPHRRRCLPRRA